MLKTKHEGIFPERVIATTVDTYFYTAHIFKPGKKEMNCHEFLYPHSDDHKTNYTQGMNKEGV